MVFFYSNGNLLNDVWILKGDVHAARNSPNPGKCDGTSLNFIALHSLFMIVSWGIIIQIGAFVARYFKHKGKIWYNTHRILAVSIFGTLGCHKSYHLSKIANIFEHCCWNAATLLLECGSICQLWQKYIKLQADSTLVVRRKAFFSFSLLRSDCGVCT